MAQDKYVPHVNELRPDQVFRETLYELWDSYADLVMAATSANPFGTGVARGIASEDDARDWAARYLIASGGAAEIKGGGYMAHFLERPAVGRPELTLSSTVVAADEEAVRNRFIAEMRDFIAQPLNARALGKKPNERILRKMATLKAAIEDCLAGIAVSGALGGADFDLHLRAWRG